MKSEELLFDFERKYKFLYEITVRGVPIYTCCRDIVLGMLMGDNYSGNTSYSEETEKIYIRRIIEGLWKSIRFRGKKTLIFTSAMYRRDQGRNLAAEYLMDVYDEAVVFEWPSKNSKFDGAYFSDVERKVYCPLDIYVLFYRLYKILHKNYFKEKRQECYDNLKRYFDAISYGNTNEREKSVIEYLLNTMPEAYADTYVSQNVFRAFFFRYKSVENAIDFWGSGRENIIPVLPGNVKSIELQHGIITNYHPGYIYPQFVNEMNNPFFKRTILVYGEKTKEILFRNSIFKEEQLEVIGNPRIQKYKKELESASKQRDLILFTSQPYEQDGRGNNYYSSMLNYLKEIAVLTDQHPFWKRYKLAVKLHPRESNSVAELYKSQIKKVQIYDNATGLYELLGKSYLQVTVSSTTLYEAAEFDVPTITLQYGNNNPIKIFGVETWHCNQPKDIERIMNKAIKQEDYDHYLKELKEITQLYM